MSKKYNRTFHLPWSEGVTSDDKRAHQVDTLLNVDLVISEKLDGSNSSLEINSCFARTHSGPPTHPSFDLLKALHAQVKYKIPENIQLFGEWLFAKHSIFYNKLPHYFLLFNVRESNFSSEPTARWLSWDEVELWAEEIQVPTVPVLFRGKVANAKELQELTESFMHQPSVYGDTREGIVVRRAEQFGDNEFSTYVMKLVRPNHVDPNNEHWMHQQIIRNKLANT